MASRVATIIVAVIVAATLVAGFIVRAQRDDEGPVDLLVFNGRVHTGENGAALQEAVAVRGNRILKVGSNRELKRLRRAQTVVVDAHGAAVLPGFNDSHVHFLSGSLALDGIDLLDAKSLEEIQSKIRTFWPSSTLSVTTSSPASTTCPIMPEWVTTQSCFLSAASICSRRWFSRFWGRISMK